MVTLEPTSTEARYEAEKHVTASKLKLNKEARAEAI
jgi:hypothetical protein